jgi:hypothetical protein
LATPSALTQQPFVDWRFINLVTIVIGSQIKGDILYNRVLAMRWQWYGYGNGDGNDDLFRVTAA